MTTYFPKSESEHLESLTHTSWNMEKQKFNVLDAMKKVTYLFISKRRLSVQELVHMYCQSCGLEGAFQEFNSSIQICQKVVLSDDSTDMYEQNIMDRYIDFPKYGKFSFLKNVSLAQFT